MLRLLIDENIDHDILRGLKDRIIVTHDKKTMIPDAKHCVRLGEPMAGVIFIPKQMAIGRAINDLELTIACLSETEMIDRIEYLPL